MQHTTVIVATVFIIVLLFAQGWSRVVAPVSLPTVVASIPHAGWLRRRTTCLQGSLREGLALRCRGQGECLRLAGAPQLEQPKARPGFQALPHRLQSWLSSGRPPAVRLGYLLNPAFQLVLFGHLVSPSITRTGRVALGSILVWRSYTEECEERFDGS